MTPDAPACLVLDLGGATTAAALLGRTDGRWRLLGSLGAPAAIPADALIAALVERLASADPALADRLDVAHAGEAWPRLVARTGPAPRLAVLAASERTLERLELAGRRAGWSVTGRSAERSDALEMTRLLLSRDVGTVLVGATDPLAADERSVVSDLAAMAAAAAGRRPELAIVLAGGLADEAGRFGGRRAAPIAAPGAVETAAPADGAPSGTAGPDAAGVQGPERAAAEALEAAVAGPGTLVLAPSPTVGDPPGEPLRRLLDDLRAGPDDGRRGVVRAAESLAAVLERRVEVVAIGQHGAVRVAAAPLGATGEARVRFATVAEAALVPVVDDALVDRVLGWSTMHLDRYRLRDRLAELGLAPWAEAHGEGAPLRMAAARAALERLISLTPELGRPVPDLLIASGGAWAVAPGPAVALALADVVRRPGASQLALDHARLLGPLGTIADPAVRTRLIADLAGDLLAPLGSLVVPAGLRAGRSAGRLIVHAAVGTTELDLVPGGLELVDLPPGESAVAEFRFRDTVVLGSRGRRFALDVGGGLGGLLVDLRDVPLRLPDRPDRRRELLGAWQRALWAGLGS